MEDDSNLGEKAFLPASSRRLTRREWVQRMLAGAGAGIGVPGLAEAHSVHARSVAAPAPVAAQAEAAAGEWRPAFFDEHQNQTLMALAEKIVPGSTGAQVNRFLDTALSADTQESQQKFVASLNALEGESLRHFTKSFKDLPADQQDEILTAAYTAQPSSAIFAEETAAETRPGAPPLVLNPRDYFDHLKGWISMAYYSSEVGMKELGWTGENFFESFPGCQHAGGHS
jgi:hypothetical protein